MHIKTTLAVIALTFAPTVALAMGCHGDAKQTTAATCIEGMTWDTEKGQCVASPTT